MSGSSSPARPLKTATSPPQRLDRPADLQRRRLALQQHEVRVVAAQRRGGPRRTAPRPRYCGAFWMATGIGAASATRPKKRSSSPSLQRPLRRRLQDDPGDAEIGRGTHELDLRLGGLPEDGDRDGQPPGHVGREPLHHVTTLGQRQLAHLGREAERGDAVGAATHAGLGLPAHRLAVEPPVRVRRTHREWDRCRGTRSWLPSSCRASPPCGRLLALAPARP